MGPPNPTINKWRRVEATEAIQWQIIVGRETDQLTWQEIADRIGMGLHWTYSVGIDLGLPTGRIVKTPGAKSTAGIPRLKKGPRITDQDRVRAWVLDKARTGEVVGKHDAIAWELGVTMDTVAKALKRMRRTGEIVVEFDGPGRKMFLVPENKMGAGED